MPSRGHFIEHQAKRKQIRARVQVFSAHLLGRHVRDGAKSGARAREIWIGAHCGAASRDGLADILRHQLRQTKIEDFSLAALGDKNIRGLDVAMNDALAVGGVEGIGDVNSDPEQHVERHRLAVDAMLERHALQQFHGDERHAGVFVNVEDRADAGVIESGGCLRLALESFES